MTTDSGRAAGLDLAGAVEAAARVEYERVWSMFDALDGGPTSWDETPSEDNKERWREQVRLYLEAAAPLIAAQVREQVAREVREQRDGFLSSLGLDPAWIAGWHSATDHHAARIARGEVTP